MRVRVFTGAGGLVLWQACIRKKKRRRQPPPWAKRRTQPSHEPETRFPRVPHGYAICHPFWRTPNYDDTPLRLDRKTRASLGCMSGPAVSSPSGGGKQEMLRITLKYDCKISGRALPCRTEGKVVSIVDDELMRDALVHCSRRPGCRPGVASAEGFRRLWSTRNSAWTTFHLTLATELRK
jgi:hypothetical protein